ncbi:MAG: hypothetical protein CMI14_11580 [Oleispira sp.]|nr:hypothetical protein [Oleispira sp.]
MTSEQKHRPITKPYKQLLIRMIDKLGEPRFFPLLSQELNNTIPQERSNIIFSFSQEHGPRPLSHDITSPGITKNLKRYLKGLYLLDPFYLASTEGLASGFYTLNDVAPDNFRETEFFLRYYKKDGIADDMGYCITLEDIGQKERYLHFSFAHTENDTLTQDRLDELHALEPLVRTLVLKHLRLTNNRELANPTSDLHRQLKQVMKDFGSSVLTGREREVLLLILHGHSSQAIADKLEIALRTVKLHRQNIYRKLDISSQAELFYLFIDSLSCLNLDENPDPLSAYLAPPSSP